MNKKAQLAEGLLPIIAFVFSALALFAFLSFNNDLTTQSTELAQLTNEIEFNTQYIFAQAQLIAEKTINSNPDKATFITIAAQTENTFRYQGAGNLYAQIRNNNFNFQKQTDTYALTIPDLTITSQQNANKITRSFDLCLEFDLEGNFEQKC